MTRGQGWARFDGTTLFDDLAADMLVATRSDVLFANTEASLPTDILVGRKRFKNLFEL